MISSFSLTMRKFLIMTALLAAAVSLPAQVVENPAKPKSAKAGRAVVPEEILTISEGEAADFYFKWPRGLALGPGGGLCLQDENQVLLFDRDGRFLRNLLKKGKGPGEMEYAGACLAADGRWVVQARSPNRLLFFSPVGDYEHELRAGEESGKIMTGLLLQDGVCYFQSRAFPRTTGDPDYIDVPNQIVSFNQEKNEVKDLSSFAARAWVVSSGGGGGMYDIGKFMAVPFEESRLVISHTSEYLLKLYDPASDKVVREFRRAYDRVKSIPQTKEQRERGGFIINDKHYPMPEQKYQNDVLNILTRNGEIWAVTSTVDEKKGVLVDVFDGEGVYQDCFFLGLPKPSRGNFTVRGACALDGDFLWVLARADDGIYSIKKYRIPRS